MRMECAQGVGIRHIQRIQLVVDVPLRRRTILRRDDFDVVALTRQPNDIAADQAGAAGDI